MPVFLPDLHDIDLTEDELDILSDHFDAEYYLAENPDVRQAGISPLEHYILFGENEGRAPTPSFSPDRYRRRYPRSVANGRGVFLHFLTVGRARGYLAVPPSRARTSGPSRAQQDELVRKHFDVDFYLASYPDIAASGGDPVEHYLRHGEAEGRLPTPDFDPGYYRAQNPDLAGATFSLFWHYCHAGRAEGRQGVAEIPLELDPVRDEELLVRLLRSKVSREHYYAANPDVAALGMDPTVHYIQHGEREGRSPAPDFDPVLYRATRPELADATYNLYWHFLNAPPSDGEVPVYVPDHLAARVADEIEAASTLFDEAYYLQTYPRVAEANVAPLVHYLAVGEAAGLRPRADFNADFYRRANPDLGNLKRSAFWHYCAHGAAEMRSPSPYWETLGDPGLLVTAIVPNYNHARFLDERLRSIETQTYPHIEIVILDDCSKDDSREVITRLAADCSRPVEVHFNETNSGNVFAQWKKGVNLGKGEIIWICESDDFCEPDFVEHMVRHFQDMSVNMTFGRIQFSDSDGNFMEGMDGFRSSAEDLDWSRTIKRPAAEWFSNALGTRNVMANVGGCMFRRMVLPDAVWEEARTFRITGDWFLYSRIAGGGQIAYEPRSVAYFRQHGSNTSASNFTKDYYYREYGKLMNALTRMWDLPRQTRETFLDKVRFEFTHFKMPEQGYAFEDLVPVSEIMERKPEIRHLQLGFLGFHSGGGEVFPIRMATMLAERGFVVSMLAQNLTEVIPEMRQALPAGIAVYDVTDMALMGRDDYMRRCGISLFHSHVNAIDSSFFSTSEQPTPSPYVVTLHGSHDFLDLSQPAVSRYVDRLARNVSAIVYTADKNLKLFDGIETPGDKLFKISNAMPHDRTPFDKTRADLGIAEDAIVFTLVARGIERKGWRVAVNAFLALGERHPDVPMHLLLVGEGDKSDEAAGIVDRQGASGVTFLGYQSQVNGIYRISDCAILPTRYPGESNPLCLIQAAQEQLPIIATDIGEIANMLQLDEGVGGILVQPQRDTADFTDAFAAQMARMLDNATRRKFTDASVQLGKKFRTDRMIDSYVEVYDFAADRALQAQ